LTTTTKHFDAIIIGTGQAGPLLAAVFAGARGAVAIIERHKFGGRCVNMGCAPTKTLVASAYAIHVARRGLQYGFDAGGAKVPYSVVRRAIHIHPTVPEYLPIILDKLEPLA
jgi:pyruvate/2-oxoglutarate dehydrogenase complex dihydrolipoamide dehydrogenase (E3) component